TAALARRRASSPSSPTAHGTYCTTSRGAERPTRAAASRMIPTARRVNAGGARFEMITPSASSPHRRSACSPIAAGSLGRAVRRAAFAELVERGDLHRHERGMTVVGIEDAEADAQPPRRDRARGRRWPRAAAVGILREPDRGKPGALRGDGLLDTNRRWQAAM